MNRPAPRLVSPSTVVPLSQSRYGDMACEHLYVARQIHGQRIDSEPARRGQQIHSILRRYVAHLVSTKKQSDIAYLDDLCEDASLEVLEIMERVRESYRFNPEHVFETEFYIGLDENFNSLGGEPKEWRERFAYEGTLDLILMPTPYEAQIHDYKSFFRIVDADTFQAKMYCLLLMCLNPAIERVEFVLEFVRYAAARSVTYTRDDLPKLKKLVQRERERQLKLHAIAEAGGAIDVTPGDHCVFCPVLCQCPMRDQNPFSMDVKDRVLFQQWLDQASDVNRDALKAHVNVNGPVSATDGNGMVYTAAFKPKNARTYPLRKALPILDEYFQTHTEDAVLAKGLAVSGLSSPLKAKARAGLKERLEQIAEIDTTTELRVTKEKASGALSGEVA